MKKKFKPTKSLSLQEYPFIWDRRRSIFDQVNLESELMVHENPAPLKLDFRPHRMQLSEVVKRAFATNIVKFMAP